MAKKRKIPKRAKRYRNQNTRLNPNGLDITIQESIDIGNDRSEGDELELFNYQRALEMHPDMLKASLDGKLPIESVDSKGDVWSVEMHLNMHVAIENQLATDGPKGIAKLALEMEAEEILGAHEVRHVIMNALAETMWNMQNENKVFDDDEYLTAVRKSYTTFCDA